MARQQDFDVRYKVLLIGESGVGKTALIRRMVDKKFTFNHFTTVGIDFVKEIFEVDGARVMLEVWDTAGQERFRTITKFHFRGTKGLLVVYDITNAESFRRLNYWLKSIHEEIDEEEPPPKLIIGNKCDLEENRQVPYHLGKQLAVKNYEQGFEETSAKENRNVTEVFYKLAEMLVDTYNPSLMNKYKTPGKLTRPDVIQDRKKSIKLDANTIRDIESMKDRQCCS